MFWHGGCIIRELFRIKKYNANTLIISMCIRTIGQIYNLRFSRRLNSIKYSRTSNRVRWLNGEETNISRTISVLVIRELNQFPDDEDRVSKKMSNYKVTFHDFKSVNVVQLVRAK